MNSLVDGIRKSKTAAADTDAAGVDKFEEEFSGFWEKTGQARIRIDELKDALVDDRAERFHEIGSEGKMVVFTVMMDADVGIESGSTKISGESGKKDGVSVIEEDIGIVGLPLSGFEKVEVCPVGSGGTAFYIVGVAAADERNQL